MRSEVVFCLKKIFCTSQCYNIFELSSQLYDVKMERDQFLSDWMIGINVNFGLIIIEDIMPLLRRFFQPISVLVNIHALS